MTVKPPSIREPIIIDRRPLRPSEEIRIALEEYRGHPYCSARKWWRGPEGTFLPGKGLTIRAELLPWLRQALERAEAEALRLGLLDEESYEAVGLPVPPELLGAS